MNKILNAYSWETAICEDRDHIHINLLDQHKNVFASMALSLQDVDFFIEEVRQEAEVAACVDCAALQKHEN